MSYCLDDPSRTSKTSSNVITDMGRVLELLIRFKIQYTEGRDLHGLYINTKVDKNLVGGKSGESMSYVFNEDESFKWIDLYG